MLALLALLGPIRAELIGIKPAFMEADFRTIDFTLGEWNGASADGGELLLKSYPVLDGKLILETARGSVSGTTFDTVSLRFHSNREGSWKSYFFSPTLQDRIIELKGNASNNLAEFDSSNPDVYQSLRLASDSLAWSYRNGRAGEQSRNLEFVATNTVSTGNLADPTNGFFPEWTNEAVNEPTGFLAGKWSGLSRRRLENGTLAVANMTVHALPVAGGNGIAMFSDLEGFKQFRLFLISPQTGLWSQISSDNQVASPVIKLDGAFSDNQATLVGPVGDSQRRLVLRKSTDTSIMIDILDSTDNGQSWLLMERAQLQKTSS